MEVTSTRHLLPGTRYEHLFVKPKGEFETINLNAGVSQTVDFIQELVPKTLQDTRPLVNALIRELQPNARSKRAICKRIWEFVYQHIEYKRDKDGVEQVRRPSRLWYDRKGDCDCMTVFISSCLMNAGIPHRLRITKYTRSDGETPSFSHIYVVVPDGASYITMDCVKEEFNSEQPYLERKDYQMKLEYLNGFEDAENESMFSGSGWKIPASVDAQDLADSNDVDELGTLGQWSRSEEIEGLDGRKKKRNGPTLIGKFIRKINRVNPATVALRNSVLLAMKVNFLKVASRIRFAYVSDAKAKEMGMDLSKLTRIRQVKDKVESIYEKAGGKKENLRAAILKGKGNKDGKVNMNQLAGLFGFFGIAGDEQENAILQARSLSDLGSVDGLGEPVTAGAALTASAAVLTPLAAVLSQVKGLFPGKPAEDAAFDAQPTASEQTPMVSDRDIQESNQVTQVENRAAQSDAPPPPAPVDVPEPVITSNSSVTNTTATGNGGSENGGTENGSKTDPGFFDKVITKAKENKVATIVIVGLLGYGAYKLMNSGDAHEVSGLPTTKKKNESTTKKQKGKRKGKSQKYTSVELQ
jgi:hypothetical protein